MSEVLLFHHILGLTPGIVAFADRLREAGHVVHTPDLFDGHTFGSIEEGTAWVGTVGMQGLVERGVATADDLPTDIVYAGFSFGVVPAQQLAETRAGARGALFYEAFVPPSHFGGWPDGLPVQIHGMDADPYFTTQSGDFEAAREFVESSPGAELFIYPGSTHLFADSSLGSYSEPAAALLLERTLAFLAWVG